MEPLTANFSDPLFELLFEEKTTNNHNNNNYNNSNNCVNVTPPTFPVIHQGCCYHHPYYYGVVNGCTPNFSYGASYSPSPSPSSPTMTNAPFSSCVISVSPSHREWEVSSPWSECSSPVYTSAFPSPCCSSFSPSETPCHQRMVYLVSPPQIPMFPPHPHSSETFSRKRTREEQEEEEEEEILHINNFFNGNTSNEKRKTKRKRRNAQFSWRKQLPDTNFEENNGTTNTTTTIATTRPTIKLVFAELAPPVKTTINTKAETNTRNSPERRKRLIWTPDLQTLFQMAVDHFGEDQATPKGIQLFMGVPGLSRNHISSHLQKYLLRSKRESFFLSALA